MKSIICSQWFRRSQICLTSVALTFATVYAGGTTAVAESPQESLTTQTSHSPLEEPLAIPPSPILEQTTAELQPAKKPKDKITRKIQQLQTSDQRWIQVNLSTQRLVAWEGGKPVYAIVVSTGKDATPTRIGAFAIQYKFETTRMRGRDYDVPNVPYAMFYSGNYAIHGAYWHRRFGTPVSHGCVNLAVNHAKWLFNWAKVGTPVIVHR